MATLPAFGKFHLGKFSFADGRAHASGTYLPGPTLFGVDVTFFKAKPLLIPIVYYSDFL